jgi:hypothetical protein
MPERATEDAPLEAMCAYQLLLVYNHRRGRPYAHLQRLLDRL